MKCRYHLTLTKWSARNKLILRVLCGCMSLMSRSPPKEVPDNPTDGQNGDILIIIIHTMVTIISPLGQLLGHCMCIVDVVYLLRQQPILIISCK
jgi:hypothetical protein